MTIECTACHARYTIADALVPPQGARVRCKKCGAVIAVKPPAAGVAIPAPTETALVPPTPEPAPPPATPAPAPPPATQAPPLATQAPPPATPAPPPAPAPAVAPPPQHAPEPTPAFTAAIFDPQAAPVAPAPAAPAAAAQHAPAAPSTIPTGTPIPEGLSLEDRQKHERARRLARVLASDVAIYNREKRERGIQDGNLVAVLGYEIKKSWETYKERVGTDFANATPYFRDALNDIVAEGKKIF